MPQFDNFRGLQVLGFRADPKSKNGLESLPKRYDPFEIKENLAALRDAQQLGVKRMPSTFYAAQLLQEGRNDFGYNSYDQNNKQARNIFDTLVKAPYNYSPKAAGFAAATFEKQQRAVAKNVPFAVAWNGLGQTKSGRTGWDYHNELQQQMQVVNRPENKDLMDLVNNTLNPDPKQGVPMPTGFCDGGRVKLI